MSTGPGNRLFPESPENVSGTQLSTVADHPIFSKKRDRYASPNRRTKGRAWG